MTFAIPRDETRPTPEDHIRTRRLMGFLQKAHTIETPEGCEKLKRILARLSELVDDWSKEICAPKVR